ncbi:MAG: DUF4097 family beta strand repeat-containing protein [Candidatus Binatia bacterium]
MESWRVSESLEQDLDDVRQVIVRAVAGEVTVTAGPRARIEVRRESGGEVHVDVRDGVLHVSHPDPDIAPLERFIRMLTEGRRHRCWVAVTAPPGAKIDVTTVSAPVVVSGFDGGTKVKSVSGDVTLSQLQTNVDVKTVSGDVEAKDIAAELKLKSVSGDCAVVDGACRFVDATTVSGDVVLDLDLDPAGSYDINTVSGDVSLRTASEPSLAVDLKTVSGAYVSDFGSAQSEGRGRRNVHHVIGDGGARLWVKTVSGDLRLLRGREAAA